jgi:ABC-type antimicrobial peptide transport system permease subunit
MGRLLLVYRLAAGDLRRHAGQAALLLLVIAATVTTLTLALILHGVTDNPWNRTFAATDGPDAVAQIVQTTNGPVELPPGPKPTAGPAGAKPLLALTRAAGVTGYSGPYLTVNPSLAANGTTIAVFAEGRPAANTGIDRPYLTAGTWVRPGGVVLDRNVADALGVVPGDAVTLDGHTFDVVGTAVTAAQGQTWIPGMVWVTEADAHSLVSHRDPAGYTVNLRLADPAAAEDWAMSHSTGSVFIIPWQLVQRSDTKVITIVQIVMLVGTWLLGLLAVASVAVLVGGRMADQTRRVGLLKAVGATPRLVAIVLLAEHLLLAVAATVVGLAAGWLIAPLLSSPSDALLGAAGAPSLTASTVLVTAGVAVGVAVLSTLVPAIRAARASTIRSLNDGARPPRRRPALNALSARLPAPLLLGLRLSARRPRRSVLATVSLIITVAMIVAALTMRYGFDLRNQGQFNGVPDLLNIPLENRVSQVVAVLTVILGVLAAINAIFITQATVLDAQRASALARAFGTTPRQVTAALCVAQLLPALAGVILGIPAGLGLYRLAAHGATHGHELALTPPLWWLLAVFAGTLLVVGALTAIPARIGARRPVALVLRTE